MTQEVAKLQTERNQLAYHLEVARTAPKADEQVHIGMSERESEFRVLTRWLAAYRRVAGSHQHAKQRAATVQKEGTRAVE